MNNKKKIYNIICITFLLLFIIIVFIYINNKDDKKIEEGLYNKVVSINSVTDVEFNDYVYSIPDNYTYEIDDDKLIITDLDSWAANIQIIDKKYSDILLIKNKIKSRLEDYGYAVNDVIEINHDSRNLLVVEIVGSNTRRMIFYTKLDKYKTYAIEFVSNLDSIDYTIIDNIIPILNTVKS